MKKLILNIAIAILALITISSCGGGGSKGNIMGQTVDNWGAAVGGNDVTIIFSGLADIYHPNPDGTFDISIPEGSYTAEFLWYSYDEGIEIFYQHDFTIVKGQTINMGTVPLVNTELNAGWAKYRGGLYNDAITHFNNYLTDVRSGHANKGSNAAFCGLGWSYARLMNPIEAYNNLDAAVQASSGTNADAYVGLGGLFLSVGHDGSNYTYDESNVYLTSAINMAGNYSSAPTHDHITETDLYAARSLARFLDGDISGCQSDINTAGATVDDEGNFASIDTLNMLSWLIGNI
jgi:hypothetical protein